MHSNLYAYQYAWVLAGLFCIALMLSCSCGDRESAVAAAAQDVTAGMVLIPAGSFWMGCVPGDEFCLVDETPRHRVTLDSFYIDVHEVTVDEYARCVQAGFCAGKDHQTYDLFTGCNLGGPSRGSYPMNCINWHAAGRYCRWLEKRLPTEAEWEYAARGGLEGAVYPWGDEQAACSLAVMCDGSDGCGKDRTWPVCSKPGGRNGYGLYDMAGNVWEWCSDWYRKDYYAMSPSDNPPGPGKGRTRMLRGGGWSDVSGRKVIRSSSRFHNLPDSTYDDTGFRCVVSR